MAASSSRGGDDYTIMETNPTKQYLRYAKLIENSASKSVYYGFDKRSGKEVAWSKKKRSDHTEESFVRDWNSVNKLKLYHSWENDETNTYDDITEYFSGSMKDYINKHLNFDGNALNSIKNWCIQIVEGLIFLHEQDPVIIHHNLSCENIYVVGDTGTIKLGDLCEAASFTSKALLEMEPGDPTSDAVSKAMGDEIYNFGLCVRQMVTKSFITDKKFNNFIRRCFSFGDSRSTVYELRKDPFLASSSYTIDGYTGSIPRLERWSPWRYVLRGRMQSNGEIEMFLKIWNLRHEIMFSPSIHEVLLVMESMKAELGLSDEEAASISDRMEQLIACSFVDRKPVVISGCVSSLRILSTEGTSRVQHQASTSEQQDQELQQLGMSEDNNAAASAEDALTAS